MRYNVRNLTLPNNKPVVGKIHQYNYPTDTLIFFWPKENEKVVSEKSCLKYERELLKYKDYTFVVFSTKDNKLTPVVSIKDGEVKYKENYFSPYIWVGSTNKNILYLVEDDNNMFHIFYERQMLTSIYVINNAYLFDELKDTTIITSYLAEMLGIKIGAYDYHYVTQNIKKKKPTDILNKYGIEKLIDYIGSPDKDSNIPKQISIDKFLSALKKSRAGSYDIKVPRKYRNLLESIYYIDETLYIMLLKNRSMNQTAINRFRNKYKIPYYIQIEIMEEDDVS